MSDCRECQFFLIGICDKYGKIPDDKVCKNPCTEFSQLPDALSVLTGWIANGAPEEAKMLFDAIKFERLDESSVNKAVPWLYSRRDSVDVRSIRYHFPVGVLF